MEPEHGVWVQRDIGVDYHASRGARCTVTGQRTKPAASAGGRIEFTPQEQRIFLATRKITPALLGAGAVGLVGIGLWAQGTGSPFALAGVLLLVGCAAAGLGGILGFLFGVPRTVEAANRAALAGATAGDGAAAAGQASLVANTNLERISDWLSTLLVGATIVQLGSVAEWLRGVGRAFAEPKTEHVVLLIALYGFALGFLGVYLITRLYLTYAFRETLSALTGVTPQAGVGPSLVRYALEVRTDATVAAAAEAVARGDVVARDAADQARLARLYGLRLRLLSASGTDEAQRAELRGAALAAIRAAAADEQAKAELRAHVDASNPAVVRDRKDLLALAADAEVCRLLDLQPSQPPTIAAVRGTI